MPSYSLQLYLMKINSEQFTLQYLDDAVSPYYLLVQTPDLYIDIQERHDSWAVWAVWLPFIWP